MVVVVIIIYEGNPEAVGWDTETPVPEKPLMDPINTQADQGSEVRGQTPGLKTRFRAGAARDPKLRGDTQNPPRVRFLTFFGRGGQKAKAQADPGLRGPRGGGEGGFPQVRPPGVGETDAEGGGPGQPTRHGPAGAVPSAPRPPPPQRPGDAPPEFRPFPETHARAGGHTVIPEARRREGPRYTTASAAHPSPAAVRQARGSQPRPGRRCPRLGRGRRGPRGRGRTRRAGPAGNRKAAGGEEPLPGLRAAARPRASGGEPRLRSRDVRPPPGSAGPRPSSGGAASAPRPGDKTTEGGNV